jgi:hypothetical protein
VAAVAALVVLVLAGAALTAVHHGVAAPLGRRQAIADALRSRQVTRALGGSHWTSAAASALDGTLERVTFAAGSRTVLEAAVGSNGTVDQVEVFAAHGVPYGDWIAYQPLVLLALGAVFVLMAGVLPVRRLRNLDVLAMLSLVPTVLLFEHGYLTASIIVVLPGLMYLGSRCAWRGLSATNRQPQVLPVSLFERLTASWGERRQLRLLRICLAALVLIFVMVGVSSPQAIDVTYAVMEGATKLIHGILPYGHLPGDVLHGDTYPIFSYALYAPVALVAPVYSTWSSVDAALGVAVLAALAGAVAVVRVTGGRVYRARSSGRDGAGDVTSLRAAVAVLCFPPLLLAASTGTTDVMLGALVAFAVVMWRRPAISTGLLAVAGWFKLAPFALVPVWLSARRGRRLRRALAALALVSAAALGLLLALGGAHGPADMFRAVEFQFSRGSLQSPWGTVITPALQPIAQAVVLALLAGVTVLESGRERELDRARVAALTGAALIALQLVSNYWSFLYLSWIVPLVGMSLLADCVPATVQTVSTDA